MSFKCGFCGKSSNPNEPTVRVVMQVRTRTYDNPGKQTMGIEIVEEKSACPRCAPEQMMNAVKTKLETAPALS